MHNTYRLLNDTQTWFGADLQVVMLGCGVAGAGFFIFHTFPGALALFAGVWVLGRIHAKDATTLPLLMKWPRAKKAYEPKLGKPFFVNIHDDQN